ncbi:peptide deformylase [Salinisphaera sp. PC39]|uniref:peptide deformylase n=1 Tax=Salinisphaera sp. PC39 TaxID=1304156 RepID=UPI0033403910
MAVLEILHFPDPRLREVAQPVEEIDASLQDFIDDMFETMYDAPGVGLAATQVGVAKRVAVMDCSEDKDEPIVMINPEIIAREEPVVVDEGCLSVPDHYDRVNRHKKVTVRAQDRHGEVYELEGEGLLAQCIQHEIDHLDGGLYIDQLSRLKRERIRRKLEKARRHRGETENVRRQT